MAPEFENYITSVVRNGGGDNTWKAARAAVALCREYDKFEVNP